MGIAVAGAHFGEAAGGDFEDGSGFGGDGSELGEEGEGGAVDVGGDEEAAVGGDEAGQFAEAQAGGVAEVAVDEFEDDVVFVDDGLVAELVGDVAEIGEAVVDESAEADGGFGGFEEGEAVDFLGAADFHSEEGADAFAAAAGVEGGDVEGGVVVDEGDGVEAGGLGGACDRGGGCVQGGAGGEA